MLSKLESSADPVYTGWLHATGRDMKEQDWKTWFASVRKETRSLQRRGSDAELADFFSHTIYEAATGLNRQYPWRRNRSPYRVLVAEIMLQQTQADRVAPRFTGFVGRFPSFRALASASQHDVIRSWQGLGYNRRALFLHALAKEVRSQSNGRLPRKPEALIALPGIGAYTSRSVPVFAFNDPHIFIETNVRAMAIYFFTSLRRQFSDDDLLVWVEKCLDRNDPRAWYEAMMDVGAVLKRTIPGLNLKSKAYSPQSRFEGSFRQRRGHVLRMLTESLHIQRIQLEQEVPYSPRELDRVLRSLQKEGFLAVSRQSVRLV